MVMRIVLLLSLLLFSSIAFAKDLTARVDRYQLGIGEQVELTIVLSGVRGKRPDIADLQKDFSIDRRTESSNVQVINGVVSYNTTWVYLLSPNRKGQLTIPALIVDQLSSTPIEIAVTEMPVAQSTSDDVLLEVDLSPANPYVQSQVAYIQRLYFSRPLVDSASISSPKLSQGDADIQFWGSSDPRYVTHKNRPYQLIERYYIIYPRKAGVLQFEPSVFNGSLASSKQRNDFRMNMFRSGTRVNAYSAKASIEIKEKPASFTGEDWLPATQVTLSVNFSQSPETLKVGEPVTVTIALMAEGLKAEVLPELKLDIPETIKSYPEKPVFRTDKASNGMVGQRQEKIVLIANEAGEYLIPEVQIPWWSVTEDKQKLATLDAVVLKVAGGVGASSAQPSQPLSAPVVELDAEADKVKKDALAKAAQSSGAESDVSEEQSNTLLTSYRGGLLGFYEQNKQAILITLPVAFGLFVFGAFAWRRRKAHLTSDKYHREIGVNKATRDLEVACKGRDLKSAIALLPVWAEALGIHPTTIAGIEASGNTPLSEAVRELTAANYSPNPTDWNGESLLKAVRQFSVESHTEGLADVGLKPLHPVAS